MVDMLLARPVAVALNVPDELERQKVVNCGWDPRFGDQRILECFQVTSISWNPPWPTHIAGKSDLSKLTSSSNPLSESTMLVGDVALLVRLPDGLVD